MNTIKLQQEEKGLFWEAYIDKESITYRWGHRGSTKIQTKQDIGVIKNKGSSNEVTPSDHAIQKAVLKANEKVDKSGYTLIETSLILEEYTSKNRQETHLDIPKPMLAHTLNEKQFELKVEPQTIVYHQPKIDGYRMLFNRVTGNCYSRSRKLIVSVPHLSEAIMEATKDLPDFIEWIDGEIYSDEVTFSQLQSILGKQNEIDEDVAKKVYYNVFDIITDSEFTNRSVLLEECLITSNHVRLVPTKVMLHPTMEKITQEHNKYVNQGYEGIILRLNSYDTKSYSVSLMYESKRSYGLFKFKHFDDSEFEIVSFIPDSVKFKDKMYYIAVTVNVKTKEGVEFEATPKMTVLEKAKLWENRDKLVGKMAKVKYQGFFESGKARFPNMLSVREDFDK